MCCIIEPIIITTTNNNDIIIKPYNNQKDVNCGFSSVLHNVICHFECVCVHIV